MSLDGDGGPASGDFYATVAYSAATGRQLWVRRYHGPGVSRYSGSKRNDTAVSRNGATVFVTGLSELRTGYDYVTVAYRG